jgi:hypothetical protein
VLIWSEELHQWERWVGKRPISVADVVVTIHFTSERRFVRVVDLELAQKFGNILG